MTLCDLCGESKLAEYAQLPTQAGQDVARQVSDKIIVAMQGVEEGKSV